MTEYRDISANVVIHGEPELRRFTPTTGFNAGKEQTVCEFRAYHPNFKKTEAGFERTDSDWYAVKYFGSSAEKIAGLLKSGMTLEVRGQVSQREWVGRDGQSRTEHEITAKALGISLSRPGLKAVDFQPPEKSQSQTCDESPER